MSPLRTFILSGLLIAGFIFCAGCTQSAPATDLATITAGTVSMTQSAESQKLVKLETNMGNITIALDPAMPVTAGNFETLVKKGYYDGVIFHRVINGFMIQGGDPTGTGSGGPGYAIKDEFLKGNRNDRGTISMANAGPNTGGSQFFINLVGNNFLDTKHPVFGKVVEGMDVVDKIAKVKTGPGDRPLQNVTIIRAVIV
jgi:peptidylprolyl isomerase